MKLFGGCRRETCRLQAESVPEALSHAWSQDPNPYPAFCFHTGGGVLQYCRTRYP